MSTETNTRYRFSVSLVTQGKHRFYTLTMPSDVLAKTCFVSTREEDPVMGFQRLLDTKRAQQIADYVDTGFGSIPNSIVLSAQLDADLKVVGSGKTLEFTNAPKAFLVLDGQHRVYGFSLAKTALRVPVVIYNGLSRQDESRLFIDINTKQRPVPNELLLDIKRLAEYESNDEQLMREVFDCFYSDQGSPLLGLMSSSSRAGKKISRVTFNTAFKSISGMFKGAEVDSIYGALSTYLTAFLLGLAGLRKQETITNPTVFRAAFLLFPEVAQRVKDKYDSVYNSDNFYSVLDPMFARLKAGQLTSVGNSPRGLHEVFSKNLKTAFVL